MTTICAIQHNGKSAMSGDWHVTLGESVIMKGSAKKIRRIYNDQVIVGFAGGVADAFTLEDKFEEKLNQYKGNLLRPSIEVAREWRGDRAMQKLEALLIVMDKDQMFLVSGSGEVIEPDDGILTIGSGGNFALAAARALKRNKTDLSARDMAYQSLKIASEICVYTNDAIMVEEFV